MNSTELGRRKLQQAFTALDANARLQALDFDGWRAWAIVKPRLWYIALMHSKGQPPARPGAGAAFSRVATGFFQLLLNLALPQRARLALQYSERRIRLPEGGSLHPHLAGLADENPVLRGVSAWGDGAAERFFLERGRLAAPALVGLAGLLAVPVSRGRKLRDLAAQLADEISLALPAPSAVGMTNVIAGHLARFRMRRAIWRVLCRRAGVRALVLTDADSKAAEVAAAKDLGLPVVEIQHGIISTSEPDFAWTAAQRGPMPPLPVPDHIVAFGPIWREALLKQGYWDAGCAHLARPAALASYRSVAMARARPAGGPFTILFPTEEFLRAPAIAFWQEVLGRVAGQDEVGWRLRVKLHPGERAARDEYAVLATRFPKLCSFVPPEVEGFEELASADLVVGYTSTMLIEAIALGIPTVALRGGSIPEGFAAAFGYPELAEAMIEIRTPADLLALLDRAKDAGYHQAWRARTAAASGRVYSWDAPDVVDVVEGILSSRS